MLRSQNKTITLFLSVLLLTNACVTAKKLSKTTSHHSAPQGHAPVGETYFDGNRAPASMSPPFEVTPEKVDLDPVYLRTKADYHFTIGEAYSYDGDANRAIEEFKLTSVYDPKSPVVRLKLAVEYVKKGMITEAMSQAEEAIQIDPNYSEARLLLGGIYSALKLYDKAEVQYKQVVQIEPKRSEAYLYLGALYGEQKRYKEAIETFQKLAQDSEAEHAHAAHYYTARIYSEKGDKKQAEAYFLKALKIKPNYSEAVVALGAMYENQKKRPQALKLYESYQDKHGPNARVAEQLSRLHLEDEEYQKAYQQLEIVLANDSDDLNAKVKMALILIELKDYPRAITRLKDILAQAPDSDKIRFFLGAVYEEVKEYSAAIEQFTLIAPGSSYYPESVIHASYLYKLKGDYENAIALIEKGIELRSDHSQFYPLYASYLDDTRQYAKAVKMLEKATQKFPTSDQMHFFLGSMQDKSGDKVATISSLKKTIELNPDHVQALNYLAYTYAELNQNLEEAYQHAKKALSLKPDDAFIQDTVGWIYFKRGDYNDAIRMLEAAYKTKSDESVIAEHLGDAYYKQKLTQKAKDMYRKAVKFETNSDNVRKIESKISAIERAETTARTPASVGN